MSHRQLLVVPQAQTDEEAAKGEQDEPTTGKVDPPQLVPSCLPTPSTKDRVVDVAQTGDEGDDEQRHLNDESRAPPESVADEAADGTPQCATELQPKKGVRSTPAR